MCVEADGVLDKQKFDISSGFKKTALVFELKKCPSYIDRIKHNS
jgi:hypothetical protein